MYQAQESLHSFLRNFPNRLVATVLRLFIFPRGRTYSSPSDEIAARVVEIVTTPGESRERLSELAYTTLEPGNPLGLLQEALELSKEHLPLERRLRQAQKEGLIHTDYLGLQIDEALKAQVISRAEARSLREYHEKVLTLLSVDDFTSDELARVPASKAVANPPIKAVKKKAAKKKSGPAKKAASTKAASKKKIKNS
jgi:acyl-CoA dehydrogenase